MQGSLDRQEASLALAPYVMRLTVLPPSSEIGKPQLAAEIKVD